MCCASCNGRSARPRNVAPAARAGTIVPMQDTAETSTQVTHTTGWFVSNDGLRLLRAGVAARGAPSGAASPSSTATPSTRSRYDHVGRYFAERGYAVSAFDLRGHGYSDGDRVLVGSFREHLEDVDVFLDVARRRSPEAPMFLLGHSMGGAIVALAEVMRHPDVAGHRAHRPRDRRTGRRRRDRRRSARRDRPRLPETATDLARRRGRLARPRRRRPLRRDPLVYRGRMPAGTLAAAIRAVRAIDHNAERASAPLLIMHGSEDQLADPKAAAISTRAPARLTRR